MNTKLDDRVLILGAGASTIAGIPTVSNFFYVMQQARPWLQYHQRNSELRAIDAVIKFRTDNAKVGYRTVLDLDNIEQLFSYATIIDTKKDMVKDLRLAIAATIDYSRSQVQLPTIAAHPNADLDIEYIPSYFKQNDRRWIASSLHHAIALLYGQDQVSKRTHRLSILSFNYDTVVEDCLEELGIHCSYGLKHYRDNRRIAINNHLCDGIREVFLAKLHGSMNWFLPGKQGKNLTVVDSYEQVLREQGVPAIIPPVWNKDANGPLRGVWKKAIERLRYATEITFVGYSFPETDMYVQYLLAAGLADNICLQSINVIDPNAGAVADRLRKWIFEGRLPTRKIQIYPARMDHFCSAVPEVWKQLGLPQIIPYGGSWHYSTNPG